MSRATLPIRVLTAVPICDGHDSAVNTINLELVRHGVEVVYLGYHRPARDVVRAAIQEDVRAVGISSYNGGHVEFFTDVLRGLRSRGATDVGVFGGGGGTITPADAKVMRRRGVDRIFFPGTPLAEMVAWVKDAYGRAASRNGRANGHRATAGGDDHTLAKGLTAAEAGGTTNVSRRTARSGGGPLVIGVTGPGGAGKTTLIDELVLRFLNSSPTARIAVLSHDPSIVGDGALLGDRAAMVHAQHDRVFLRSLAARGRAGGLAPATERCLDVLRREPTFDVVLVETVGVGQEALPFGRAMVDRSVLVMSPDYGSRLQLQKIVMLDAADVVVVNKSDLAGARTASSEIEQRLALNGRGRKLVTTCAKRHRDAGVDALFRTLTDVDRADGLTPSPPYSGERAAVRGRT